MIIIDKQKKKPQETFKPTDPGERVRGGLSGPRRAMLHYKYTIRKEFVKWDGLDFSDGGDSL